MKFIRNNSLSLVFLVLFLVAIIGQFFTGMQEHNKERAEDGKAPLSAGQYIQSGHFIQATFENWESEFLQMALFVWLTIFLYQKGSSESKASEEEEVDREPSPHREGAPWPVRQGGWILAVYKHSLTIALLLLFLLSFAVHLYGSLKDENEQLADKGLPPRNYGQIHYRKPLLVRILSKLAERVPVGFHHCGAVCISKAERFFAIQAGGCTQ